jgi:hypothetical protein
MSPKSNDPAYTLEILHFAPPRLLGKAACACAPGYTASFFNKRKLRSPCSKKKKKKKECKNVLKCMLLFQIHLRLERLLTSHAVFWEQPVLNENLSCSFGSIPNVKLLWVKQEAYCLVSGNKQAQQSKQI